MKYSFLFIALLMGLLASCGKKRTFHLKAINAVTGEGYSGLQYKITATKTGTNGEKKVFEEIGNLNANGEAMVEIKVKPNRTYNIGCKEPVNTCFTRDIKFTYAIQDEENPTFQFEYAECSNFKLEIHNINCLGPTDEIKFKRSWSHGSTADFFQTQTGCFDFTGEYFQLPIGDYIYEWEVTRNGLTTYHDSLFSLTENQFYTFNLEY